MLTKLEGNQLTSALQVMENGVMKGRKVVALADVLYLLIPYIEHNKQEKVGIPAETPDPEPLKKSE